MINLTNASLKIYLALQPCDMRKSFNGLTEIATEHLGQELVKEVKWPQETEPETC